MPKAGNRPPATGAPSPPCRAGRRVDAIAGLSRREQEILRLRFLEGLTQTAIGERLGLAQFQVSRILRASLDELRSQLER